MTSESETQEADALQKVLRSYGDASIGAISRLTGVECSDIYRVVRLFPERFDVVGVFSPISTYHIAIADKTRPIQFVVKEDKAHDQ